MNHSPTSERRIPATLQWAATLFVLVWFPVYWREYGLANFLWVCDFGLFVLLAGLWLQSRLLISSQAIGVLAIQLVWAIDYLGRLILGFHPVGGTEYMWSQEIPIAIRAISLFHLVVPIILIFGVRRLGYDRRGFWLQTAITWLLLPISFFLADPERNLNWVWRPFEREQTFLSPTGWFLALLVIYPVAIYLPSHWLLQRFVAPRPGASSERA